MIQDDGTKPRRPAGAMQSSDPRLPPTRLAVALRGNVVRVAACEGGFLPAPRCSLLLVARGVVAANSCRTAILAADSFLAANAHRSEAVGGVLPVRARAALAFRHRTSVRGRSSPGPGSRTFVRGTPGRPLATRPRRLMPRPRSTLPWSRMPRAMARSVAGRPVRTPSAPGTPRSRAACPAPEAPSVLLPSTPSAVMATAPPRRCPPTARSNVRWFRSRPPRTSCCTVALAAIDRTRPRDVRARGIRPRGSDTPDHCRRCR